MKKPYLFTVKIYLLHMNITKFSFFFSEIFRSLRTSTDSHRKSSVIIDNCRKMAENSLSYTKENNIGPFGAVFGFFWRGKNYCYSVFYTVRVAI